MPRPKVSPTAVFDDDEATILHALCILHDSKTVALHPKGKLILDKLDQFHAEKRITFDGSMPTDVYGESAETVFVGFIRLHTGWSGHEPTAALVMAHEAVHLVEKMANEIDEELACREFDCDMITEIMTGIPYTDAAGRKHTAQITGGPLFKRYNEQVMYQKANQLIDTVLALPIYAKHLDKDWVVKNLHNWGGLSNRWATSLGHYVRVLADGYVVTPTHLPQFVEVLEAIPASHWSQAKAAMGNFNAVLGYGRYAYTLPGYGPRLDVVSKRVGEKLQF